MTSWGRRQGDLDPEKTEPFSPEDLARRIGATDARPEQALRADRPPLIGDEAVVAPPLATVAKPRVRRHAHPMRAIPGATRRVVLWRDASAVLFVAVLLVIIGQMVLPAADSGPGPLPSNLVAGESSQPTAAEAGSDGPGTTWGPAIDASLIPGIEATATPLVTAPPVAPRTAAPAATPRATPRSSTAPSPSPSAPVTAAPTDGPTAAPTDAPTPAPTDAPTPAPTAAPTDAPTPAPTPDPMPDPTAAPSPAPTQ